MLLFIHFFSIISLVWANGYVCWHDAGCAESVSRPVFLRGESVEQCCGKPDVVSVTDIVTENCTECGQPLVERITPYYVALIPPSPLVLEVRVRGFTAVTWLVDGTAMHAFRRLQLSDYSTKFTLVNTTIEDFGLYEADVHMLNESTVGVTFIVGAFCHPQVSVNQTDPASMMSDLVNLTCTGTGNPLPELQWSHNDSILQPTYTFISDVDFPPTIAVIVTLDINTAVALEEYTCVAAAYHGGEVFTANTSLSLEGAKPRIYMTTGLGMTEIVTAPDAFMLSCTAIGRPAPEFVWLRSGIPVKAGGRFKIKSSEDNEMSSSSLNVTSSEFGDCEAMFICNASNALGSTAVTFNVTVEASPNVTVEPASQVVNQYDSRGMVKLTCRATGFPAPQLIWVLGDGGRLTGYCSGNNLSDVFDGDIDYTDFYDTSDEMDMMGEAPMIPGEAPTLPTTSTPSIQSNITLFTADRCKVSIEMVGCSETISVLTIQTAGLNESTNFTCLAENGVEDGDKANGASGEVMVAATPIFLERLPSTTSTVLSLYVSLSCTAISDPAPNISWYSSTGEALPGTVSTKQLGNSTVSMLGILNVQRANGGSYMCEASNSNGNVTTTTFLDVKVPANITQLPQDVQVPLSSSAVFTCEARGFPLPNIFWGRVNSTGQLQLISDMRSTTAQGSSSIILPSNVSEGVIRSQLQLTMVELSDADIYACSTTNGVNLTNLTTLDNATAELVVTVPLQILTTPPSTQTISEGSTLQVNCSAKGVPLPTIEWNYQREKLEADEGKIYIALSSTGDGTVISQLVIISVEATLHAGNYSCRVSSGIPDEDNVTADFVVTITAATTVMPELPVIAEYPAIETITYVALGLAILFFLLTALTHLSTRKLRGRIIGQVLVNLCLSLIGLLVCYLLAQHARYYDNVRGICYAVAALLQYFMLVYLIWVLIETAVLYARLVGSFKSNPRGFIYAMTLIAWGLPAVITAACTAPGVVYNYYAIIIGTQQLLFCLATDWPFYIGMVLPLGIVYLFTWTLFLIILCFIVRQVYRVHDITWEYVRLAAIAFMLSVVFATALGCGLAIPMTTPTMSTDLQYIFSFVVLFMGVFYFILHVLFFPEARQVWINCLRCLFCCSLPPKTIPTAATDTFRFRQTVHRSTLVYANEEAEEDDRPAATLAERMPPQVEIELEGSIRDVSIDGYSLGHMSFESQTFHMEFAPVEDSDEEEGSGYSVEMQQPRMANGGPRVANGGPRVSIVPSTDVAFTNTGAIGYEWPERDEREEEEEEEEEKEEEDVEEEETEKEEDSSSDGDSDK